MARGEKRNHLEGLLPEIANEIIGLLKSPLQTCEIVHHVYDEEWYEYATPDKLIHLIRIVFFDPGLEVVTDAENLAAALAHVQQVLVNNFGQIDYQKPVAWLKNVLRRLCDGYARASTAIRAMEPIQPWEDGFVWGAGPGGASIEIPGSVVAPYPLSAAWGTQTTIDTFLPLQAAKNLTVSYRRLLAAEEREKTVLKERTVRNMEYKIIKLQDYQIARLPDSIEAFILGRSAREYNALYNEWLTSRNRTVNSLPKEFENKDWLPMHKRTRMKSIVMRIDPNERRILAYDLYAVDVISGETEKKLVATEYVHGEEIAFPM